MKKIFIAVITLLFGIAIFVPQNVNAAQKSTYKKILAAYKKNDMKKVRKLSKNLPAMANEKCVKKMKFKYKKASQKVIDKIGFFDGGEQPAIMYYGYSDVDKDGKPELIIRYGASEQGSTIRIYQYKGGKYKKVKGSADGWHTVIYNYTSGNGLVLTDAMTADKVYERVRLVTLKKGRMKVKVIRKREFKDFNDRLLLPCVIETY